MVSSVWTSVSQKEKPGGDRWVDNNADLKVSKSDFDQNINCYDFVNGACEFSLSYGKVLMYN